MDDYDQQRPAYVRRMKRYSAREHAQRLHPAPSLHPTPRLHPTPSLRPSPRLHRTPCLLPTMRLHPTPCLHPASRLHPTPHLHPTPTTGYLKPKRREDDTGHLRPECPAEYDTVDTAQAATARVSKQVKITKVIKFGPRLIVDKYLEMKWKLSAERKLLWCCGDKTWKEYQKPYEERRRKSLPLSQREELLDAGG
jgi:hypothetical protein